MKKTEILLGLAKIPLDLFANLLAFIAAYSLRKNYPDILPGINLSTNLEVFQPWDEYMIFAFYTSIVLILIFAINNHYSLKINSKFQNEIGRVFLSTSFWMVIIIAYFFFTRELFFSRLVLAYVFILSNFFIFIGRIFIRAVEKILIKLNIGRKKVILLGSNKVAEVFYKEFKKNKKYKLLGIITDSNFAINKKIKVLGEIKDFEKIIRSKKADQIIQTNANLENGKADAILNLCRELHLDYSFVPDLIGIHQKNIEVSPVAGIPLIHLKPTSLEGWGRVYKRIFDLVFGSIILICLSPIMFITALAIKYDSKGTILFKYLDDGSIAKRVGENGKLFRFYKFRSMYPNTHNLRYTKLSHLNTRQGTPMVKIKDDPRVTKVGKFIRKTSIDELPQLFNVIKGDLSLVGPRAHLPEEVERYASHHKFVLSIKPGITGLAQISGRSDLHFDEEIKLDRYYIENWSLFLDLKILLKTFFVVLKRSGADD